MCFQELFGKEGKINDAGKRANCWRDISEEMRGDNLYELAKRLILAQTVVSGGREGFGVQKQVCGELW